MASPGYRWQVLSEAKEVVVMACVLQSLSHNESSVVKYLSQLFISVASW